MKIIPGFKFLNTYHCITGSMVHLFQFHNCPVSEEMLLGLGEGIGLIYWHPRGDIPFLGGRANTRSIFLEELAAERCGVSAARKVTSSRSKAEKELLRCLKAGIPVMLQVDMGLLPYFPFFGQFHFGYHGVVAAGFDPDTNEVTLADRDATPYPVQLEQVTAARSSTYKPFSPQNAWMEYDFSGFHQPDAEVLHLAIRKTSAAMLNPPIRNMGVRGIQTACQRILAWPETMNDQEISVSSANITLYIRADAGTGGGLFRWMYARFLRECSERLSQPALVPAADEIHTAGVLWEQVADQLEKVHNSDDLSSHSAKISALFDELAKVEKSAWSCLLAAVD